MGSVQWAVTFGTLTPTTGLMASVQWAVTFGTVTSTTGLMGSVSAVGCDAWYSDVHTSPVCLHHRTDIFFL